MQKLTSTPCEHQSDFFDSTPANASKRKDYKILQIAPLDSGIIKNCQITDGIIGMALLEENGETQLAYVAHDPVTGRPVIKR